MSIFRQNEKDCILFVSNTIGLDQNKINFIKDDPPDAIYGNKIGIEHTQLNYNFGSISPVGIAKGYKKINELIKICEPPFGIYPDIGTVSSSIKRDLEKILEFLKDNQWNISILKNLTVHQRVRVIELSQQSGNIIISDKKGNNLYLRYVLNIPYLAVFGSGNQSSDIGENIRGAVTGAILDKTEKIKKKDLGSMEQWLILEDSQYQYMVDKEEWSFYIKEVDKSIFDRVFIVNYGTKLFVEL